MIMGNEMTFSLGHKVDITFMPVELGTFVMGDEEEFNEYGWAEKPKHEVTISKRFWLGEFPVTRIQWQYVMGYKSYEYSGGINRPIENITWEEAQAFCKKLNGIKRKYNAYKQELADIAGQRSAENNEALLAFFREHGVRLYGFSEQELQNAILHHPSGIVRKALELKIMKKEISLKLIDFLLL